MRNKKDLCAIYSHSLDENVFSGYNRNRADRSTRGVDTIMICEFCEVIFLRSRQKFAGVLSHGKDF